MMDDHKKWQIERDAEKQHEVPRQSVTVVQAKRQRLKEKEHENVVTRKSDIFIFWFC